MWAPLDPWMPVSNASMEPAQQIPVIRATQSNAITPQWTTSERQNLCFTAGKRGRSAAIFVMETGGKTGVWNWTNCTCCVGVWVCGFLVLYSAVNEWEQLFFLMGSYFWLDLNSDSLELGLVCSFQSTLAASSRVSRRETKIMRLMLPVVVEGLERRKLPKLLIC